MRIRNSGGILATLIAISLSFFAITPAQAVDLNPTPQPTVAKTIASTRYSIGLVGPIILNIGKSGSVVTTGQIFKMGKPIGPIGPLLATKNTTSTVNQAASSDVILVPFEDDASSAVVAGAKGDPGPQGPQGIQGLQGLQGTDGRVGPAGATGATGAVGPAGATGAMGPIGATGAMGPTGLRGEVGAQGIQGVAGAKGADGANGADGAKGADGANGSNGADGAKGADGANGTNATVKLSNSATCLADEIVTSLTLDNSTEGESKIGAVCSKISVEVKAPSVDTSSQCPSGSMFGAMTFSNNKIVVSCTPITFDLTVSKDATCDATGSLVQNIAYVDGELVIGCATPTVVDGQLPLDTTTCVNSYVVGIQYSTNEQGQQVLGVVCGNGEIDEDGDGVDDGSGKCTTSEPSTEETTGTVDNQGDNGVGDGCADGVGPGQGVNNGNGTNGKDGKDGLSAYELAVERGFFSGSLDEWISEVMGANRKVAEAGPQGIQGLTGLSAYEVWVADGHPHGTKADFFASLKGDKGDKGDTGATGAVGPAGPQGLTGASAFEVWLNQGANKGKSFNEFFASLKGDKGDKGDTGATGAQGPAGPQGAAGATGPQGPAGPQGATGAQGPAGTVNGFTEQTVCVDSKGVMVWGPCKGPGTQIIVLVK